MNKKLMIAVLVATAAGTAFAYAETRGGGEPRAGEMRGHGHAMRGEMRGEMRGPAHAMRGEMRDLIRGDGMDVAALANLMQQRSEERFDQLDADGDGVISREEFLAGIGERAERVFARMDRDEDGLVTPADRPRKMMRGAQRGEWRGGGRPRGE